MTTEKTEDNNNQNDNNEPKEEKPKVFFTKTKILLISTIFFIAFKLLPQRRKYNGNEKIYQNVFYDKEKFSLEVYLSDGVRVIEKNPIWRETGIEYGSFGTRDPITKKINVTFDRLIRMNKLYVEITSDAYEIKHVLKDQDYKDDRPLYLHKINKVVDLETTKRPLRKSIGALSTNELNQMKRKDQEEDSEFASDQKKEVKSLRNKIYIHFLHMQQEYIDVLPLNVKIEDDYFQPHLDCSQFWSLERDTIEYNDLNRDELIELEINFGFIGSTQFQYQKGLQMGLKEDDQNLFDIEDVKEVLTDNTREYLYIVLTVNILHVLFSFLSYFHDIKFWRNKKSYHGLSINQVYWELVTGFISFLYMLDADAKFIIVALTFVELVISLWKVFKVTRFEFSTKFPFIRLKGTREYEGLTADIEKKSTRLMLKILTPILAVYTIYTYKNTEIISHYSFVISTLMSFCLMFGFIEMTPQLFINHKLKTVEHMNWNGMIYKFLNTIIDDLFAFMLPMPFLKRLSMFRDDVVFVIYLYQRWIYRVDKNRTETGFIDDEKGKLELESKKEK